MRLLIPAVAVLLTGFWVGLGFTHPSSDSPLCLSGLCRMNQVYEGIDAKGLNADSMSVLLDLDPANPSLWCAYAEQVAAQGDVARAGSIMDRAVTLGPDIPPVLMRAANFDFMNGRAGHGLALGTRLLGQTDVFDQILFSYFLRTGVPVQKLLGASVPATPRVAVSWLGWVRREGTDDNLRDTWSWMVENRLADAASAVAVAQTLWERQSFEAAQEVWGRWAHAHGDPGYLAPERLFNRLFRDEPGGSPFDWALNAASAVEVARQDGLELHFLGKENVNFSGIRQFATVTVGRYRFSAEIGAAGLTTDEGPYFRIYDAENVQRLSAATSPVLGSVPRSEVSVEFTVPPGTRAVAVQIERKASQRFDNRILGSLHVYRVSLVPAS